MSFVVDARGAVMLGRRHCGLRFIVPPSATSRPARVQCRLVPGSRLPAGPPLSDAEALATRVLDFGPTRLKFDTSVQPLSVRLSVCLSVCLSQLVNAAPGRHGTVIVIIIIYSSLWRGTVVERRSLAGELSLSCARPAADG